MKHTKQILTVVLMALLIAALAVLANAEGEVTIVDSGYCGGEGDGTNLTWTLDSEGALTISGEGEMTEFVYYGVDDDIEIEPGMCIINHPWYKNGRSDKQFSFIKSVVIEDGVTSIGAYAFFEQWIFEKVSIGNSVERIGPHAFDTCLSLKNITIPDSVQSIGDEAFRVCKSLESVVIGDGVECIGSSAFGGCFNTSVRIGKGLRQLGHVAVCDVREIIVSIENPFFSSEEGALFNKDKTKLIQYPDGNRETVFEVPESVTEIAKDAICICPFLDKIIFPTNLKCIRKTAPSEFLLSCEYVIKSTSTELDDFAIGVSLCKFTLPSELKKDFAIWLICDESSEALQPYIERIDDYVEYPADGNNNEFVTTGMVICHSGSTAEAYAIEKGMDYELVHFYDTLVETVEPTCTERGYSVYKCIHCDSTETRDYFPALDHDYINHDAKAPTCLAVGWDAYQTCSRCDYSSCVEKPATGHTEAVDFEVAPACTTTGLTEGKHCSVCSDVLVEQQVVPALGHIDGDNDGVCDRCNAHVKDIEQKQNLNFFQRIIQWIKDLFAKLFGKK